MKYSDAEGTVCAVEWFHDTKCKNRKTWLMDENSSCLHHFGYRLYPYRYPSDYGLSAIVSSKMCRRTEITHVLTCQDTHR
jgi:hypothetical protein